LKFFLVEKPSVILVTLPRPLLGCAQGDLGLTKMWKLLLFAVLLSCVLTDAHADLALADLSCNHKRSGFFQTRGSSAPCEYWKVT